MYFCELNTTIEYLVAMYIVLARRQARVLKEEMQEGSSLFTVYAYVPVAENFGFANERRRWTSGACSTLLVFSHWETLEEDPFFVPKTEEEIEEFGDGSSVLPNTARKLIDAVRRRKGLPVEEKVVQHGIKRRQRSRAALKRKRVKVISDLLISISKPERQEARAKVRHDSLRLGIVGVIRAGTIISETWEDGEALKDLNSHLGMFHYNRDSIVRNKGDYRAAPEIIEKTTIWKRKSFCERGIAMNLRREGLSVR
ncbi:hypothetical protein IFM89_011337 [Coptis chinensis]|uniref:Elongation factor EFG domain-containing protein n=1 Tax=Coptis chinensis TaxID=261450 RepID=A0A835MCB7_9MAGN|nr:hypothetical protein IFM89_011337 [Coptis chinensis]